jgi:unsaturated chondroitin disaccharide hydrolase
MKKIIILLTILPSLLFAKSSLIKDSLFISENFKNAQKHLNKMLDVADVKKLQYPRTINKNGVLVTTDMYDWTPGFFPGLLWNTYEFNQDDKLQAEAIKWTQSLEPLKNFEEHHDLGFMMYCSYGNAYRFTKNKLYKDILVQSARSLSTRYNATTGSIKSWNTFNSWHGNKKYSFPVIIDNMMNLELLFFASAVTGDTSFKHIALTHALNTMKNQIRSDYSSYHVVCYDTLTGKVEGTETAQGLADNSTWARGQAWGIYGFTMVYRESKDKRFLKTAQGMADYFINHPNLPADKVPYWDFNLLEKGYIPGVNSNANNVMDLFRDASAASITASALLELSLYSGVKGKKYYDFAIQILHSLASANYMAAPGTNANFILKHSVGSIPHNGEIDVPLIYADYYFLEALNRYNQMSQGKPFPFWVKK